MRIKLALLATTALALTTVAAQAASPTHRSYVSVFGGANFLNDSNDVATAAGPDTFTLNDDPDTGYVAGVTVGAHLDQFLKGLRVEVEASYRDNKISGTFATSNGGGEGFTGVIDADQSNFAVLANIWYDVDLGMVTPYVGGGVGWAQVQADGRLTSTDPDSTSFDTDDSGFAWQLGAGLSVDISPNVELGVGYRYFQGPEIGAVIFPPQGTVLARQDLENVNHTALVEVRFGL